MKSRILVGVISLIISAGLTACSTSSELPDEGALRAHVRQASHGTYMHGMSAELANREVGEQGVPILIELLADDAFSRPDNVVAFLGFLADERGIEALKQRLATPWPDLSNADTDRALLLIPLVLGHFAERGHGEALELLLDMTAHHNDGGLLATTASQTDQPEAMLASLVRQAIVGLTRVASPRALERVEQIADGRVAPLTTYASLALQRHAASLLAPSADPSLGLPTSGTIDTPVDGTPREASGDSSGAGPGSPEDSETEDDVAGAQEALTEGDPSDRAQHVQLTYANHPAVTDPMTDARLDDVLGDGNLLFGRSDFNGDAACCIGFDRVGSAAVFGSLNDGLDVLDTSAEMDTALNDPVARVKVVRAINNCGGPGTNIIGCAWVGGNGMTLVRMNSVNSEAILWTHEYGHNTGLNHSNDSRMIMYGSVVGTNRGVSPAECAAFHSPAGGTEAMLLDVGACTDNDVDDVQDVLDNCPDDANFDQADADGNGVGDLCEGSGPVCGDGAAESPEVCDGSDLGGAACSDIGCSGGSPTCAADCGGVDYASCTGCATCGDGVAEGDEVCDGSDIDGATCPAGCTGGAPTCNADCGGIDFDSCTGCPACNNNGVCESGEDCTGCPSDCASSSGASCGNGVCEAGDGEDCVSCPSDCAGRQNGKPGNRYCCGDGGGENPIACSDARCSASGLTCSDSPATGSCCGDLVCEGGESSASCEVDCGAPPTCGSRGAACSANSDCCSNGCKRNGTCR